MIRSLINAATSRQQLRTYAQIISRTSQSHYRQRFEQPRVSSQSWLFIGFAAIATNGFVIVAAESLEEKKRKEEGSDAEGEQNCDGLRPIDAVKSWIGESFLSSGDSVSEQKHAPTSDNSGQSTSNVSSDDVSKSDGDVFDLAKEWFGSHFQGKGVKFFDEKIFSGADDKEKSDGAKGESEFGVFGIKELVTGALNDDASTQNPDNQVGKKTSSTGIFTKVKNFVTTLFGSEESTEDAFLKIVTQVRHSAKGQEGGDRETGGFTQIASLMSKKVDEVNAALDRNFGHLDISNIDPTAFWYYLELEDERKNPSWKRLKHRYYSGVDVKIVSDLNDALHLADTSYFDSVKDIESALRKGKDKWELIYCETSSLPEQPGHYLAIKKGQSKWGSSSLDVLLVVRGTKTVEDVLTDALLESEEYRGGEAHAGMVRSGKYLAKRHRNLLEKIRDVSGMQVINLSIIGHSLGAGAAAIAAMELNDEDFIEATAIGFGCPPMLSQHLSESTKKYITSVIGDCDVIPRLSAATIGNLAMEIMQYDWTAKARRDVQQALEEVRHNSYGLLSPADVEKAMNIVNIIIKENIAPKIKEAKSNRTEPTLFPPGKCVHFYRDGRGVSGTHVPCTFFDEIHVSRTMVDDHLIGGGYKLIFLDLMRSHHDDLHFRFETDKRD